MRTWEQWQQQHCQGSQPLPTMGSRSLPSKALCTEPPRLKKMYLVMTLLKLVVMKMMSTHRRRWTRTRKNIKSLVGLNLQIVKLVLSNHVGNLKLLFAKTDAESYSILQSISLQVKINAPPLSQSDRNRSFQRVMYENRWSAFLTTRCWQNLLPKSQLSDIHAEVFTIFNSS